MTNPAEVTHQGSKPKHVAIIMDGNGRWAEARNRPRAFGHQEGVKSTREIVEVGVEYGLAALTLFAFSSENWQRPKKEVDLLMGLLQRSLKKESSELARNNIRVRFIGDMSAFSDALAEQIQKTELETAHNTGLNLAIALNYGGRWDITQAARQIAQEVEQGTLTLQQIDENVMAKHVCLADVPDPDLFIRTGGEYRISNYLLWQLAYTELYFTPVYWPDFRREQFLEALAEFPKRQRRFGLTGEQASRKNFA